MRVDATRVWVRRAVYTLMCAIAAACGESPESGYVAPKKVTPLAVHAGSPEQSASAWALFDRDTSVGYAPDLAFGGTTVRVKLEHATRLAYLKVFGSSPYELRVTTNAGEPLKGFDRIDLSALGAGWSLLRVSETELRDELLLHFTAKGQPDATSPIPELELWSVGLEQGAARDTAAVKAVLESSDAPLAEDFDLATTQPEAALLSAAPTGTQCATFRFMPPRPPAAYRQAWLAYVAEGAFRPFVLTRVLNTQPMRRGQWLDKAGESGLFVEPIDPEALSFGENKYDFCVPTGASGSVAVRDVRFLGELERGSDLVTAAAVAPLEGDATSAAPELLDPASSEPRLIGTGERVLLSLGRYASPDLIILRSSTAAWDVSCLNLAGEASPLEVGAGDERNGLFGLFVTPGQAPTGCAVLALAPRSAGAELAHVAVVASGSRRRIDWPRITLASAAEHFGRVAWVDGWANAPSELGGSVGIDIDGSDTGTQQGVFGQLLTRTADPDGLWPVTVTARFADGSKLTHQFVLDKNGDLEPGSFTEKKPGEMSEEEKAEHFGKPGATASGDLDPKDGGTVKLGTDVGVEVPPNALPGGKNTTISITHLTAEAIPKLDPGMFNVTAPDAHGYEFLPHGLTFKQPVQITLPYDASLIPPGYTPNDVHAYYFDTEALHWKLLSRASVDTKQKLTKTLSDHFTVMINAVVVAPEHPQIRSFNPNEIRDIQAADPGSRVNLIEPPGANSRGDATLSYPLELPPGRRGLEPSLALSYDSSRGNGWVGLGWDLPMRAITIDTRWGVPRYNPQLETETYLLEGEQLTPFAHRGPPKLRSEDTTSLGGDTVKVFHTRIEGNFQKIIRRGTGPTNYFWEVIDKAGTRYFYGADPDATKPTPAATLGSPDGIFAWALRAVVDRHGNSIRYEYEHAHDSGYAGSVFQGDELYPSSISYTCPPGKSTGPYTVKLVRDSKLSLPRRSDVIIDGRGRFKRVTADLLSRVEVLFGGQVVRAWQLRYREGAFHKSLLSDIIQLGAGDASFAGNEHHFSYFDEIREDPANVESAYKGFDTQGAWDAGKDAVKGNATVPAVFGSVLDLNASLLGASETKSSGEHFYMGFNPGPPFKQGSYGFKLGSGSSSGNGRLVLIDLDGDGLPDKVFSPGSGAPLYRRNLSGPSGSLAFDTTGPPKPSGLSYLGKDRSSMTSYGFEGYPGPAQLMLNIADTFSESTSYFSDVNGDGLPDFVDDGHVFFNVPDAAGNPTFVLDQAGASAAPLPIQIGAVDKTDLVPDYSELAQTRKEKYPLVDVVRRWNPPANGIVTITGAVRRLVGNPLADEVHVSIWRQPFTGGGAPKLLWSTSIAGADTTPKTPTGVSAVAVGQNEFLYFRVSSVNDVKNDVVQWDPVIEYANPAPKDSNGLDQTRYQASSDFILAGRSDVSVRVPFKGMVKIAGSLLKPITSDDVRIFVLKNNEIVNATVKPATWDSATSLEIKESFPVEQGDDLRLFVETPSPVDLAKLLAGMSMELVYLSADDAQGKPVIVNGTPLFSYAIPFDASVFSTKFASLGAGANEAPYSVPQGVTSIKVEPSFTNLAPKEGKVRFTVKRLKGSAAALERVRHYDFDLNTTSTQKPDLPAIAVSAGDDLYFGFSASVPVDPTKLLWIVTLAGQGIPPGLMPPSYLHLQEEQDRCSRRYRGWSFGALNGALAPYDAAVPGDFCKKDLPDIEALKPQPKNIQQAASQSIVLQKNLLTIDLVPLPKGVACPPESTSCDKPSEPVWSVGDGRVYIGKDEASPARLGAGDITVPSNSTVIALYAPQRISSTKQTAVDVGVGAGPLGVSASRSTGTSQSVLDYMDMNGDGYPDVVGHGGVQYTTARGTLAERIPNLTSARQSSTKAYGAGINANPATFESNSKGRSGAGSNALTANATTGEQMPSLGVGVSLGASLDTSETDNDLHDVNGDGLPDRVIHPPGNPDKVFVQLNLGYAFGPPEPLGDGVVNTSNGTEVNGGPSLSFNDGVYGFGGGLSGSKGRSQIKEDGMVPPGFQKLGQTLLDVNGDGLPDRVVPRNGYFDVAINTGAGFAKSVQWKHVPGDANDSSALKLGGGGYFTYAIGPLCGFSPPLCYIILNPGADASTGMNRQEAIVTDLNGDGHPDHLTSTEDGEVKVALNLTGRTNLLSRVERPMGGRIELEYARSGNTRAHPQSRWVMTRVTTFDGLPGDWRPENPGADYELTTIQYDPGVPDDGRYDRFEREFYGYSLVVETEHDTRGLVTVPPNFESAYRRTTRQFRNDSFFTKGLLSRETVEGPGSPAPRFSDVENHYTLRDVATGAALTTAAALHDTLSAVFPELTVVLRKVHEGNPAASIQTIQAQEYDSYGNVTKLVDSGDPSTAGDDFVATMTYTGSKLATGGCALNHIVGLADSITVKDAAATLLRYREASFDCSNGDLLELRQQISAGKIAKSNFSYDAIGNLATVQGPTNLHGQRYTLAFGYDAETQSHVTSVTDNFGYVSTATYDLRFGVVRDETDQNGNTISRAYDPFGRLESLTGPYQQGTGLYTLAFAYRPDAPIPWALTRHIDTFRDPADPIETILFTDGMKRVIQTKKDATLHQSKDAAPVDMMIVSGRVAFDHVGRTIEAFYPITEPKDASGATNITFNPTYDGIAPTTTAYDVMNRVLATKLPDTTTTTHAYDLAKAKNVLRLATTTTDELKNSKITYRDIRDQIRAIDELNGAQHIWTLYEYDPVQQLVAVQDDKGNLTKVVYDLLGRRTAIDNPDTGKTQMAYDPASNLTEKTTANLAAKSQSIRYDYDFNRLTKITYPEHPENDVAYEYGGPNATGNRAGRLTKVTDESGKEERWYGKLGEIVQETKTVASDTQGKSEQSPETWTTKYVYDTWGRLQQLTYPDSEVLTYKYDSGGLPHSVRGVKQGNPYPYVQKLEYDKFEQRTYLLIGNGVEERFTYNPLDRRLSNKTAGDFQHLQYKYDPVGNVTALDNKAPKGDPNEMGGPVEQTFAYDALYRLTSASGTWHFEPNKKNEQTLSMAYDSIHNIVQKTQGHQIVTPGGAIVPQKKTSYANAYKYTGSHPHAPTQIGDYKYLYDKNGNQTGWDDLKSGQKRVITWDEENRIQTISDNGKTSHFKYNDAGERVIKRTEQGETAYVNQFWTVRNRSIGTKHIFVGETRISSKVVPGDAHVNAGGDQWASVLGQWWLHRSVQGWKSGKNTVQNPHYAGNAMPDNLPEDNFVFFYHPDHLGSTEYVTDYTGELYEHVQYFAFGETWVSEHKNTEKLPYLFTSKELDEETGLYYFGARYYDPRTSVWQSPDPALATYLPASEDTRTRRSLPRGGPFASINFALFAYARNNPIRWVDREGLEAEEASALRETKFRPRPARHSGPLGYRTAWEAGRAALERYNPLSIQSKNSGDLLDYGTEYGGLLYESSGRFYYTEAVAGDKRASVDPWQALSLVPANAQTRIVGDYHTHGGPSEIVDGEVFSGFHYGLGVSSPSLMGSSDVQEARADLVRYRANILDPKRFTSFLGTPQGRFGVYNPSEGFVFTFSPDSRLLPRGGTVPAASYSWR